VAVLGHLHDELRFRVIEQQHGIPREVARTVCRECGAVLREDPIRRPSG
jgi:hypothetical protein